MRDEALVFDGWDAFAAAAINITEKAGYVVVWDLEARDGEGRLGRLELDAGSVLPYLEQRDESLDGDQDDPEQEDDGDDGEDQETDDDDSDPEDGSDTEEAGPTQLERAIHRETTGPTQREMLRAACRWVRSVIRENINGAPYGRFRVRVYTPKGKRVLQSTTLQVENRSFVARPQVTHQTMAPSSMQPSAPAGPPPRQEAPPATASPGSQPSPPAGMMAAGPLRSPAPVNPIGPITPGSIGLVPVPADPSVTYFHEQLHYGAGQAVRHLGEGYAHLLQLAFETMRQMHGIQAANNKDISDQLHDSRGHVDQLMAAWINDKVADIEAQQAQVQQVQQVQHDGHRTALAQAAINQIGAATQALLSRGMPPELAPILSIVQGNPAMLALLQDPTALEVLRNPASIPVLAQLLKSVGPMLSGPGAAPPSGGPGAAPAPGSFAPGPAGMGAGYGPGIQMAPANPMTPGAPGHAGRPVPAPGHGGMAAGMPAYTMNHPGAQPGQPIWNQSGHAPANAAGLTTVPSQAAYPAPVPAGSAAPSGPGMHPLTVQGQGDLTHQAGTGPARAPIQGTMPNMAMHATAPGFHPGQSAWAHPDAAHGYGGPHGHSAQMGPYLQGGYYPGHAPHSYGAHSLVPSGPAAAGPHAGRFMAASHAEREEEEALDETEEPVERERRESRLPRARRRRRHSRTAR